MNIHIREYREADRSVIILLMEELQKHISAVDPLQRNRCAPGYGDAYAIDLIQRMQEANGWLGIAVDDDEVLGCVALTIQEQSALDLLAEFPLKEAKIIELIVRSTARSKGIGTALMTAAEAYAREKKCDSVRVEVFSPNVDAHRFYQKLGYADRCVELLKIL